VQIGGKSRTCFACLATSPNRRSNPGCSSWIIRKFFVMIPSSRYYKESIFIHYSCVTFYVCSFPHINIHTSRIFSELVSQYTSVRMTQFFYILIYSIHVKVYCYCLTFNCYCPIFNCYCPIFNCYFLIFNCYCPIITV